MVEIKLQDGYFIEVDPLNYTLRQRYSGEDKGWRIERICQNTWILRKHPAGGRQIHNSFSA